MTKFKVFQDADYVQGHLRYGHREGIIEADSEEEAKEYYRELCNYGEESVDNIYFEGEILD